MPLERAEGLILRLHDFSESSRVVTLYTREFGKMRALAKGGKRLRSPFESALDLLAHARIVLVRKSGGALHLLTEAVRQLGRHRARERIGSRTRRYGHHETDRPGRIALRDNDG